MKQHTQAVKPVVKIRSYMRDFTGQRFGRLTVLKRLGIGDSGHVVWECQCDCGNTASVASHALSTGTTHSCGCLALEYARSDTRIKYPGSQHNVVSIPYYKQWLWNYRHGVFIHESWHPNTPGGLERFLEYINTELGPKPSPSHRLKQIELGVGLVPGNLHWVECKPWKRKSKQLELELL